MTTDHIEDVRGMVYAFRRKGQDAFCTCNEDRYNKLSGKPNLFETTVLYTHPANCPRCAEVIKERDEFESCLREIGFLVDFDHNGGLAQKVEEKLAALEAENKRLLDAVATYQKKWMDSVDATKDLANDMERLMKTIRYLVGIAERGSNTQWSEGVTAEHFVLDYVKSIEAENARLNIDSNLLSWFEDNKQFSIRFHKGRWSCTKFTNYEFNTYATLRDALAAAMDGSWNK